MAYRFLRGQEHGRAIAIVTLVVFAGLIGFGIGRADCAHTFWPLTWSNADRQPPHDGRTEAGTTRP